MPYEYLDDIAIADIAFRAKGKTLEELFCAASDATMGAMVENVAEIGRKSRKEITLAAKAVDLLLFQLLEELIFYKDAEQLLLRVSSISIREGKRQYSLSAILEGERIDPQKHELIVDVKAVTLYRFRVENTASGWQATVVLDV